MGKQSTAKTMKPATSMTKEQARSITGGEFPEGFQNAEQRFEVSGFWQPALGPVHGVVVGAYEFKQKTGKGKGQKRRVFVLRLAAPTLARVKLEGGGFSDGEKLDKGELCGVFYSAGLRELTTCLGCMVLVKRNPEEMKKPTERGDMWTFSIGYKGLRKPVVVRPAFESETHDDDDATSFDPSSFSDDAF